MSRRSYLRADDLDITVSKADIEHAVGRNQFNCAIVRAIQRKYPEATRVRVNAEWIGFTLPDEDKRFTYPTPPKAVETIIKPLDTGGAPKPGRLKLSDGDYRGIQHNPPGRKKAMRDRQREVTTRRKQMSPQQKAPQKSEYNRFAAEGGEQS